MKKFSISTQLLILVFTILLFTSCIFMVATYFTAYKAAESQVYTRLDMYLTFVEMRDNRPRDNFNQDSSYDEEYTYEIVYTSLDDEKENNGPKDMDIYSYICKADGTIINNDLAKFNTYFTQAIFDAIIDEIKDSAEKLNSDPMNKFEQHGKIIAINGQRIYFSCSYHLDTSSYSFVYTNNDYAKGFIKSTFLGSFAIFIGMLILAVAIIYGWSAVVTRRLRAIQNHIIDLPKNRYEKAYVDLANDEIGELSRSVEEMREEIGNNEKTKQEMLQNLSHDFKTPIAVIKSYAEAYQDGMAGPEVINTIIDQAEILKRKVNRLLQYNSLEYLTKDKPFEKINMTDLVRSVVTNYKFQTNLTFNLLLEEDIYFEGYRENWSTVVENIIDNATRYAKEEIKIELKQDYLRIYNDGEPIDSQFLNSVFKPYEKGSKGQFGLGMSIVLKTVNFFDFTMNVKNEDIGVSFIITK